MPWTGALSEGGVVVHSAPGGLASGQTVLVSAGDLGTLGKSENKTWGIDYLHWTKGAATKFALLDASGNLILNEIDANFVLDRTILAAIGGNQVIISATVAGSAITARFFPINAGLALKQL